MIDFEKDIKLIPEDIKIQALIGRGGKNRLSLDEYFLFLESITDLFQPDPPKNSSPRKYYETRFEL